MCHRGNSTWRGNFGSLFFLPKFCNMNVKQTIQNLLLEKFQEPDFQDCYIVELKEFVGKRIEVYVDSDSGLDIKKCQQINRYLGVLWDTNPEIGEKYDLEVSSPGISRPLQLPRQYIKNIGRDLKVIKKDNSESVGLLKAANQDGIVLEYLTKTKEGKKTIKKIVEENIEYNNIQSATIKLAF